MAGPEALEISLDSGQSGTTQNKDNRKQVQDAVGSDLRQTVETAAEKTGNFS
jgi:hypothetical protein